MALKIKNPESNKDVTIVYLEGRLDVHYSAEVEEEINKLISEGHTKLLIDLHSVEYLSSSGLRIFIAISRKLKEIYGVLKLMRLSETTRKIFKIVELIDMFDIYDTEEDALASFA